MRRTSRGKSESTLLGVMLAAVVLLVLTSAPAGAAPAETDLSRELAARAVAQNPDIAALKLQIRALEQRVAGAGAWPDPLLSLSYQNMPVDRWAPGASPMSGIQLMVKQSFYWPGKVGARKEQARAEVALSRQGLAEQKVRLRATVRRAYYRLTLSRQLRQVTAEHIKLLDQLIDAVRVKYEVGKVGQHELLRLQLLRGKLQDELQGFSRDDASLTAAINAALDRPPAEPVKTPPRITPPAPPADLDALIRDAAARRPLLKAYLARAESQRAAARRAAREGYPDISAWFGYTIRIEAGTDPGTNFVTLGLAVPLPVLSDTKWEAMEREASLRAQQAERARAAELSRIRGDLAQALARWRRAAQKARTYGAELMPAAHKTLDATFAAYQVDRADFSDLFQAELQLLDFERAVRRAEAEAALAAVQAEALVGAPLSEVPAPERSNSAARTTEEN